MPRRKVRNIKKELDFGEYTLILILFNKKEQALDILSNQYDISVELDTEPIGFTAIDHNFAILALHHDFKIADLVHELMHLTYMMLSRYGINLSDETHETYAMQIDSLFRIVISLLKEHKVKLPMP